MGRAHGNISRGVYHSLSGRSPLPKLCLDPCGRVMQTRVELSYTCLYREQLQSTTTFKGDRLSTMLQQPCCITGLGLLFRKLRPALTRSGDNGRRGDDGRR